MCGAGALLIQTMIQGTHPIIFSNYEDDTALLSIFFQEMQKLGLLLLDLGLKTLGEGNGYEVTNVMKTAGVFQGIDLRYVQYKRQQAMTLKELFETQKPGGPGMLDHWITEKKIPDPQGGGEADQHIVRIEPQLMNLDDLSDQGWISCYGGEQSAASQPLSHHAGNADISPQFYTLG